MKNLSVFLATLLVAPLLAESVPAVSCDPAKHTVTFTARSTDCGLDTPLEFLFVGPNSDHDYEALFVTDAPIAEIAAAFAKVGLPTGRAYDGAACRLWPVGTHITIEPALTNLLRQTENGPYPALAYTGGARGADGLPVAATNSPNAVFALYNCAQSLLQFDDSLPQSATYGRFQPAVKIPRGEVRTFTFAWDGAVTHTAVTQPILPGKLAEALLTLREQAKDRALDVLCDFSPELTLKEAVASATALKMIDSVRVKINGVKEGQYFYQAYLPLEKWRDRKERLCQPPEIHLKGDAVAVTEIVEDWNEAEGLEPKLIVTEHTCADLATAAQHAERIAAKTGTLFLYAPPTMKLERLYAFRRLVKLPFATWYVFTE